MEWEKLLIFLDLLTPKLLRRIPRLEDGAIENRSNRRRRGQLAEGDHAQPAVGGMVRDDLG